MKLKNRKIYGMRLDSINDGRRRTVYVNMGENKYLACGIRTLFENVHTWKIATTGPRGGTKFVPLLDNAKDFFGRDGQLLEYFAMAEHFIENKDFVSNFKHGSYLVELDEFIPLQNGKIRNRKIQSYKGFDIKFNTNGVYGFSIWRGNACLEDRLWSIAKCKNAIDEIKGR